MQLELAPGVERRKQVRLKVRADLIITEQRYEGKRHYVVKDPVSLRYYRFNEQEYFVFKHFDGKHTMEETQKAFEAEYRPQRLTHEDLEAFARQLLTAGLVQHESSRAADELLDSRKKQRRMQRLATLTNILYVKIPIIDPDRLLTYMASRLRWLATWVWWYTPGRPFINNLSLCLMTLCSVSTFVFNANPLMRFDGYYIMADWLEIPNLRDRCNKYLKNLFCEHCLGMEVPPEQYMALNRRILFFVYAVASYVYRWVLTFSIIYTIPNFLTPYKLGSLTQI